MRTFRSDNNAGLCPEALQAIVDANAGHHTAYGDDSYTPRAVEAFRELFGSETSVFFVATGTAANALAVASLAQPWQQVVCHAHSHVNYDESTVHERFSHCRVTAVRTDSSKLTPDDIADAASRTRGDVHQPQAGVVSISNTTEFGTVYTPQETKAICRTAHELGYRVHVDGARFANAVASLNCPPRDLAAAAGVDALSFGGTKNGLAYGEAVLFFPQDHPTAMHKAASDAFPFHRKSTGHLLSKHRFVSAPFLSVLRSGAWLNHARHANAMAKRLSEGLIEGGYELCFPTQANAVFVTLPGHVDSALKAKGHGYYDFGEGGTSMARLMASFDTQPSEVDALLADAMEAIAR